MTSAWHWFVIVGTLGSLAAMGWLLLANRQAATKPHEAHEWDGISELDTPLPMWWVGMFVASIVFALGYLVYYPGLGNYAGTSEWRSTDRVSADQQAHAARFEPLYAELNALPDAELAADRRARQIGRRLFLNHCSTCHGVAGQGSFGFPNLTDSEWIWGSGLSNVQTAILNGRTAAMAPWLAALGEDGVQDAAQFVRSLSNQEHDVAAAERGKAHYQTLCIACHGPAGTGNPLLGAPDLTNDIWLYGGSLEQIAFTVRNGRNGNMPAHAEMLGTNKARILASYVNSLSAQ
ncbi:MAG: cytochrome-c oxidase, cbb3-type subunit III [Pseudomonadales bacterium]